MSEKNLFENAELVSMYTRKQAIEDGFLVDISETSEAKEAGFKIPVALTRPVYALVEVPKDLEGVQDFKGRLWDVCYMATLAFRTYQPNEGEDKRIVPFKVLFQMEANKKPEEKALWLVFNEQEGFTIMFPSEY